jgi:small-conductance mechanosensitive channel
VDNAPETRLAPDRRFTLLAGAGAVAALIALLLAGDPAGRLLAGVAAVLLVAYVVGDLVFSPRVVASAAGVVVNTPLTRTRLGWSQIEDVRTDDRLRFGLRSTTLEIDAGSVLAVLSRRSIGTDPELAADLIRAHRPPG